MIRVAFLLTVSQNWIGGYNYIKNLLEAINTSPKGNIEVIIFVPCSIQDDVKNNLRRLTKVVEVSLLEPNSVKWRLWRILRNFTQSDFMIEIFLWKYRIDVFSHSNLIGLIKAKSVNWIPDFQHLNLPEMFSNKETIQRSREFMKISKKSDTVILSSYDALKDYRSFAGEDSSTPKVLQFASRPIGYNNFNIKGIEKIKNKFKIENDYILLPNHFWKHKNHMVAFKAFKVLKSKNYNVNLVCTGKVEDYRDATYSNYIKEYIIDNEINVKILGIIDYDDLIVLMKNAITIINPSLFEGWSTTVEECKSLGKNIILSDIDVHKEQNPDNSYYFNPNKVEDLVSLLEYHINNKEKVMTIFTKSEYESYINKRFVSFSKQYESIIMDLFCDIM